MVKVNIFLKDPEIPVPKYKTEGAAGLDLPAGEDGVLNPGERRLVPTGLVMEIPEGYEGQVRPRSGLAIKNGITLLNSPGTIDSDYRGEVCVVMYNTSGTPFIYKKGDRIAQIVFSKVAKVQLEVVDTLTETARGEGGFGSTGR